MTFTSLGFALFFVSVFILYAAAAPRLRWGVLLAASYLFFACLGFSHLVLVLAVVTLAAYFCGLLIGRVEGAGAKRLWLWTGLFTLLAQLVWLKYLPFLTDNVNLLGRLLGLSSQFQMPRHLAAVGVSYFVFQGISYLVDVYLGVLEPEPHLGRFALAMSFFPKLLQGPIERSGNLLPQLQALAAPNWQGVCAGAHLFLWGFVKKAVLADRLAPLVDAVYRDVHQYNGLPLLIATYLYAMQIFFDFSGYTDMALGLARVFNIRLTQNFQAPYLAKSTADFWRRWHISLSSWILDYLFRPLQLALRSPKFGTPIALLIVFLVSGLWHGASWTFVAWGGIHGVYLATSVLTAKYRKKLLKSLSLEKSRIVRCWQVFVTFHLVCFAWIFFRADSLRDAMYVAVHAVTGIPQSVPAAAVWMKPLTQGHLYETLSFVALMGMLGMLGHRLRSGRQDDTPWLTRVPVLASGALYGVLFYLIAFRGSDTQTFIYMQF